MIDVPFFLDSLKTDVPFEFEATPADVNRLRTYSYRFVDYSFSFRRLSEGLYIALKTAPAHAAAKAAADEILSTGTSVVEYEGAKFTVARIKAVISNLMTRGYAAEYRKTKGKWVIKIFTGATICFGLIVAIEKGDKERINEEYIKLGDKIRGL